VRGRDRSRGASRVPDAVGRFWGAAVCLQPSSFRTAWGYVAVDPRFPDVGDANNATVLTADPELSLETIRVDLVPALRWAGAGTEHIEFWDLSLEYPAFVEARAIGMVDRADVVMVAEEGADRPAGLDVEVVAIREPDEEFWPWYRSSLGEFGSTLSRRVLDQLTARVREVFLPTGMQWFVGLVGGERAGYTSLISLEGVGYLDNVVTMPGFRRRGVASETVAAAVRASHSAGNLCTFLLAEEGGRPQALYERLGFTVRSRIETLKRPLEEP
jgi:ribosomal protein S18 acetylase RimI-like enzyme